MHRLLTPLSLAFLALLVLVALAVFWHDTPAPLPPTPPSPMAPAPLPLLPKVMLPSGSDPESVALRRAIRNGERIYQRLCYHCHGRQGKGNNNDYMESVGHKPADHTDLAKMQKLSDWEFFLALRDGVKDKRGWLTMPPWESVLTPAEMWDVITYVRRLPLSQTPNGEAPMSSQQQQPEEAFPR
jgi:mono/diheme cytochrome c family protein